MTYLRAFLVAPQVGLELPIKLIPILGKVQSNDVFKPLKSTYLSFEYRIFS